MKSRLFLSIVMAGAMLCITPATAQSRGGGGHSGGRSSGGSYSSPSRSSSYSSPSRSSSSSYSSPSRSSSSSYSSPSRSNSSPSRSSSSTHSSPSRSSAPAVRSQATSQARPAVSRGTATSGSVSQGRPSAGAGAVSQPRPAGPRTLATPGSGPSQSRPGAGPAPQPRPSGPGYAPGRMPPSARPMHPVFYHPIHHGHCHVHVCPWDCCIYHHWHWPGFWLYCNTYWYDYHCTDVYVVRQYVQQTYNTELVAYAVSGDLMYALVKGQDGDTYLQVYDQNDKVLAEQRVSSKYVKMEVDRENGGCWILKKKDKDPMLFIYQDEKLLIYEAE